MKKIVLFFLLISTVLSAQKKVEVDLSNPNATIYTHLYFLQPDSYYPEKAATTIYGFEGEEAQEIAIKLKKILDGKGLKIDFNKVPINSSYSDTIGQNVVHKYVLFPHQIPEIYVEKIGDNWYYSRETTSKVQDLYRSVYPWYTEKLQQMIPSFGHKKILYIELWQLLGLLVIIGVCTLMFYVLKKIVYYLLRKIQFFIIHRSNDNINSALRKLTRPVVFLLLLWFVQIVLPSLLLQIDLNTILFLGLHIMSTVFWIYVFLKSVQVVMSIYAEYAESTHNKLDDQLVPILNNFLRGLVLFLGLLKLLTLFGVEPVTVLMFYVLKKIVYYLLRKIQFFIIHRSNDNINSALRKLTRPVVFLLLLWFVQIVLPSLLLQIDLNTILFLGLHIMSTVFWIYVFLKSVQVVMSIYAEYAESTHNKLDDQLVPILNNFLRGLVLFLGLLKLLTLFGVEPVTVLAGASIGGLAVALASQDTVKNLIGTVMIFIDKPFHIGDWIEAGEVVGTVETVGFRSTTVRAADTSVYQIPNSALSEMVVNNKGLRAFRRYTTNLGLRYDTPPELIEAFVEGVRKIVALHPSTRDDAYNVEFVSFGDSALLILLNVYFVEADWSTEQASKHSLHIAILKFAKELGVDFAFPSTTVMIEQFPERTAFDAKYNTSQEHIKKTIDNINLK